jgi:trypsin-like peptidase
MASWAWSTAPGSNQVVTITPEAVAAHEPKPVAAPAKTKPLIWVLLIVSLLLSGAVAVLAVYFFKHTPTGLSGLQIISRFHTIALIAGLLAALGVIVSASVFDMARRTNEQLKMSARVVGIVALSLGAGLFGTAVFCWSKTESAASLSSPQQTSDLLERLQSATAVIQMYDPQINRYSSSKRQGVVIAADAGRTWILTVPYFDRSGNLIQPNDVWVNLSDGRTLPGRFRWAAGGPGSLAIVEVMADAPPGQVQFHPAAEAIIPSRSVFVIPNPLRGWTLEKATVLSRLGRRTSIGWNCLVETDLALARSDMGSAMYDETGRLLGLMISLDEGNGNSAFVMVDSATVSVLESIRGRKHMNAQNSSQEQQP